MMRRVFSLIVLLVLSITLLTATATASTNGHTQGEALEWTLGKIGTAIDADGAYGVQCVDLIKLYYSYLGQTLSSIGYAKNLITWDLPAGWNRYSNSTTPQTGDIVVYDATSGNPYGHVGIVTYVSSAGYNYVDYNGAGNNDAGTHRFKQPGDFTCVIRPDFYQQTASVNIGKDFYAVIANSATNRLIEVSGNNVQISSATGMPDSAYQIWHFIRNSAGDYAIINKATGGYMDADSWGTDNGTNIQCVSKNDTTAQRWYVIQNGSNYNISPIYCNLVMDWNSGGTNVMLYSGNNTAAQLFSINIICNVTFDATGGTVSPSSKTVMLGNRYGALPTPTKTGYSFLGWGANRDSTSYYTSNSIVSNSADHTLFAIWKKANYNVTLNTNGGRINKGNVTSYTYGTGALLPSDVTKAGFVFGGWYNNIIFSGNKVTEIGKTETGNKTFYANWLAPSLTDGKITAPMGARLFLAEYSADRLQSMRCVTLARDCVNVDVKSILGINKFPANATLILVDAASCTPLCASWNNRTRS